MSDVQKLRNALILAKGRMHNIRLMAREGSLTHELATDALKNIDKALERRETTA